MNSIPSMRIFHCRGLRQGVPLSPMLFILVIDALGHMIVKAAEEGMLQPLGRYTLQHQISLYADDVALLLHLEATDIVITMDILHIYLVMHQVIKLTSKRVMYFLLGVVIMN
jgi:hypothetical protein